MFLVCHMFSKDYTITWSCDFVGSKTHAKFGGHRHHGSGDIIVLIYHVILQDHMIKGFCDFMGSTSSR